MITKIFLAANQVPATPWWAHIQIVGETENGEFRETEVQVPSMGDVPIPGFDWVVHNDGFRDHTSLANTPYYEIEPGKYQRVELHLDEGLTEDSPYWRTPDQVWNLILQTSEGLRILFFRMRCSQIAIPTSTRS